MEPGTFQVDLREIRIMFVDGKVEVSSEHAVCMDHSRIFEVRISSLRRSCEDEDERRLAGLSPGYDETWRHPSQRCLPTLYA